MFGIAISSSSPAVAARCSWARAGVGAVATQNITDPSLGMRGLDAMSAGLSAERALRQLEKTSSHINYRQLLAVDSHGNTCIYSGTEALGIVAESNVEDAASAGNLLDNDTIPEVMIGKFQSTEGHLGDRLIGALQAAVDAGGEAGPVHSAGLLLVDQVSWPVAELRCDWLEHDCPISNVANAWSVYKPQLVDYLQRALDPTQAPGYGVPGSE